MNNKNFQKNNIIFWIFGVVLLLIGVVQFSDFKGSPKTIDWAELKTMLKNREVERIVVINKERANIILTQEAYAKQKYAKLKELKIPVQGPHFYYNVSSPELFQTRLSEAQKDVPEDEQIYFESDTQNNYVYEIISWILPLVLFFGIWIFIFKRMGGGGGIFNVGKSKAKMFDKESTAKKVTFNDVAGLKEAKQEVTEIVDFLKNPGKYTKLGGKIPKGALLVGPPGTGKTLLAKAVAGEADVPFFSMSGSDFVEMFVGVGASRVRDLFNQAKQKAPCIVFIDEIDAVGRARSSRTFSSNDERESTLNQLLTEMDGFDTNTGIIMIGATNRVEILDSALLRAGRFDRQIMIELPDLNERGEIFDVHLKGIKVNKALDLGFLAKQTPGFSGADIANVCNEAALIAARHNKEEVDKQDFLDAIDRIIGGLEKKNKIITETEKRTIAFHEAGHATVSWLLENAQPLIKVTIVPRGKALGAAWYLPEERQITTKEQMIDEMCSLVGGRASEEVNFGRVSTGALNDLERVTKYAYAMVTYYGMSEKLGNMSFYSSSQDDYNFQKPYSEKTAELIDAEVKALLDQVYERTKQIIIENKEKLAQLAELLLEREVIFTEDVENIFGKRKFANKEQEENEASESTQIRYSNRQRFWSEFIDFNKQHNGLFSASAAVTDNWISKSVRTIAGGTINVIINKDNCRVELY
ncbi:MAG: ATP-dependent zinc metalloprotease FtsH, partial [Bacteroidales bacterium]|nr:ATP-dependent zinc metalloprotease FtsH [Bacteroidales bacterium]